MKKISLSSAALVVALMAVAPAHAGTTPGWYATAGAALTFAANPTIHAPTGKSEARAENTNVGFLGGVGYAFGNGLRMETQYFRSQNNILEVDNVDAFGHVVNNAFLLNAFYDFENETILTPYIGAGIGPNFVSVDKVGTAGALLNGRAVVAAYQAIVGVAAQVDENWAVTADYRYIGSFDPKVSYTGGTEARLSNASQNFVLGVRYSFGVEDSVVPAAAPVQVPTVRSAAPAKAQVAPVGETFMVFFDFDKATLTPEAKRIIASAAQKYKAAGFAKIVVTGHTDTVGTADYNQKLSERRALAVRDELAKLGVSSSNIRQSGVGEGGLLVPTTEGVREAQNRRAEIVLTK